jgi:hypothetical protein
LLIFHLKHKNVYIYYPCVKTICSTFFKVFEVIPVVVFDPHPRKNTFYNL